MSREEGSSDEYLHSYSEAASGKSVGGVHSSLRSAAGSRLGVMYVSARLPQCSAGPGTEKRAPARLHPHVNLLGGARPLEGHARSVHVFPIRTLESIKRRGRNRLQQQQQQQQQQQTRSALSVTLFHLSRSLSVLSVTLFCSHKLFAMRFSTLFKLVLAVVHVGLVTAHVLPVGRRETPGLCMADKDCAPDEACISIDEIKELAQYVPELDKLLAPISAGLPEFELPDSAGICVPKQYDPESIPAPGGL